MSLSDFVFRVPLLFFCLCFALPAAADSVSADPADAAFDQLLSDIVPGQTTTFVGDMGFRVQTLRALRPDTTGSEVGPTGNAALGPGVALWSGGIIPYAFDGTVSLTQMAVFNQAGAQWEAAANVHFVPRTTQGNYILVHTTTYNNSYVGQIGGAQTVNIASWDYPFLVCHELGHVLGLIHEHNRDDRDKYISVDWDNLPSDSYTRQQFVKLSLSRDLGAYDFDSVMHYGEYAFSADGGPTLVVNAPWAAQWQGSIGQFTHLSVGDKAGAVALYGRSLDVDWSAQAVTVGSDGAARLLWDGASGTAAIQRVDTTGLTSSTTLAGNGQGQQICAGLDGSLWTLWMNTSGVATLTRTGSTGNTPSTVGAWGPFAGWQAVDVTVGSDGAAHLLWTNTDGRAGLWTISASGNVSYGPTFGPFANWTAQGWTAAPNGLLHLLWERADGAASLWTLDGGYRPLDYSPVWGPFAGWTVTQAASGADSFVRLLWTRSDGSASLWTVDDDDNTAYGPVYTPGGGWTAHALSCGSDGLSRLLWTNSDGHAGVWLLGPDNTVQYYGDAYSPF